jgi:hypothetical protein
LKKEEGRRKKFIYVDSGPTQNEGQAIKPLFRDNRVLNKREKK